MRQDQVTAELYSRAVEESLRAAAKEHERLIIFSKESQHGREQAKQVRGPRVWMVEIHTSRGRGSRRHARGRGSRRHARS